MPSSRASGFQPTPVFREKRRPKLVKLALRNAQGEQLDIMVRNVSARGLNAAARGEPPRINEVVTVHLPEGHVHWGIVRWVEGNLFGVEFDTSSGPPDTAPLPGLTSGANSTE